MIPMPCAGLLRQVRRLADLSQRQLATRAGLDPSVVARVEAGRSVPTLKTLERLLAATGFMLQAVGPAGQVITAENAGADFSATRDAAGRHFPAHLDTREPSLRRPWWFDLHGATRVQPPLLTFSLSRRLRDHYRHLDERDSADDDARLRHPFTQSRVVIPGYRPKSQSHLPFW